MSVATSRALLEPVNGVAVGVLRAALGEEAVSTRELDRIALAIDASHYLRTPDAIMRARHAQAYSSSGVNSGLAPISFR